MKIEILEYKEPKIYRNKKIYTKWMEENKTDLFQDRLFAKADLKIEKAGKNMKTGTLYRLSELRICSLDEANLVLSLTQSGHHKPLIDVDRHDHTGGYSYFDDKHFPALDELEKVSSTNHFHYYCNRLMSFDEYINALEGFDGMDYGWYSFTQVRGYGALRLPWIEKTDEEKEKKCATGVQKTKQ